MRHPAKALAAGLTVLAAGLIAVAVLGPLVTTTIQYRYSPTMLNQATGLDAFALAVVAPLAVLAAVLVARRHPAGPLVALAPAGFALYMLVQYVIGPEYLLIDGNGERAFLLFAALFVVSASVMAQAWSHAETPPWSDRMTRRRGAILLALAFFVVAGMYLANGFLSAMWDFPSYIEGRMAVSEYDEHPTAYWIVAFLDLAVVVPLTVATGVGLLRRRAWARRAFYGVVGWYGLVPASVAAMALTMLARNDPAAQGTKAIVLTVAAAVSFALAITVFLPLFRAGTWVQLTGERAPESASTDDRAVLALLIDEAHSLGAFLAGTSHPRPRFRAPRRTVPERRPWSRGVLRRSLVRPRSP